MKYTLLFFCFLIYGHVNSQPRKNTAASVNHLSEALQIQTVSICTPGGSESARPFVDFVNWVKKTYPLVHQRLDYQVINNYSLLYYWKGADQNRLPGLFIGHIDVVPAELVTLDKWDHPPFSGYVDENYIWGRGALDNKSQVIALLETLEKMLGETYVPAQDLYFAFGHDEECGGKQGAGEINKYFESRGFKFEFILDEGGAIIEKALPGVSKTLAFIAVAEKGHMDVEIVAEGAGGHSSVPPDQNPIDIIAKAITSINAHPMQARLGEPTKQMMRSISPYLSFKSRLAVKHDRIFEKKILKKLNETPFTSSLIRTMITATMIDGGIKENVLPVVARANLNVRIMPGDSVESVLAFLKKRINDERVTINLKLPVINPTPISSIETKTWKLLQDVIESVFPGVAVVPYLFPATTDSHQYAGLTKNIYRFIPVVITYEDREKIHGIGERIGINDFLKCVQFYSNFIRRL